MGEVYRARDTRLDRIVALKVLPSDLVRDEGRVSRFVREARAASALSHPNIVTIHEIGEAAPTGLPGSRGETGQPLQHYIAMELVEGRTLRQVLARREASLDVLVGWLAQAAEGLAKAHEAGVVHRDLKPENIMVSRDGFTKVLDFGLAKLHEPAEEGELHTGVPTLAMEERTREGTVLGTVGYMSPEQVQGLPLDPRTDIFSLGCMLYEAACGERPFAGETPIDVQHQILRRRPRPIDEIAPAVPRALQRLILRCLVKERERRLQSMRDLALELRDIVDDWSQLAPASAASISGPSATAPIARGHVGKRAWIVISVLVVGLATALAVLLFRAPPTSPRELAAAFETMRITPLTSNGKVVDAAISPDGRYVAHTTESPGHSALRLLQVATGSDVEVLVQAERIRSVAFSPDGDYLYFTSRSAEVHTAVLFQVPALGGMSRQVAFDVDTGVGPSPDGRRLAFVRGDSRGAKSSLVVRDADGGERVIAVRDWPWAYWWDAAPAWSPDGATIAVPVRLPEGEHVELLAAGGGEARLLPLGNVVDVEGLAWLPDARHLVLAAKPSWGAFGSQLWRLDSESGSLRRVTNDPNSYRGMTLTADGRSLATIQRSVESDLWVLPVRDPDRGRRLGVGGRGPIWRVESIAGDAFVFLGELGGALHLWSGRLDDEALVRLTERAGKAVSASVSEDGRVVLYSSPEGRVPQLFAMDGDGGNVRQLTRAAASAVFGVVSPDGSWIAYYVPGEGILRAEVAGGAPPQLISASGLPMLAISPDGQRIAYTVARERDGELYSVMEVTAAAGGGATAEVEMPAELDRRVRWTPDGQALSYSLPRQGGSDVWLVPLDGSPATALVSLDGEMIFDFDWVDADTLLVSRGSVSQDVVLISDFQ